MGAVAGGVGDAEISGTEERVADTNRGPRGKSAQRLPWGEEKTARQEKARRRKTAGRSERAVFDEWQAELDTLN